MIDQRVLQEAQEAEILRRVPYRVAIRTQADMDAVTDAVADGTRTGATLIFGYLNWCAREGMGESVFGWIREHCGELPEEDDEAGIRAWAKRIAANSAEIMRLQAREVATRRIAQRKARRLLRSMLSPAQRRTLDDSRSFLVRGSLGGRYRLWPATGGAHRVVRRGKRLRIVEQFCLHDPGRLLPPADVSIAHMLMLRHDEAAFRRKANITPWLYHGGVHTLRGVRTRVAA